jgi:hypothetical protein
MKILYKLLLVSLITTFFYACGDPTIDTSTDETMKISMQKVKNSLPVEKQAEFDQAVQVLFFSQFDMQKLLSSAMSGKQIDETKVLANSNIKCNFHLKLTS